MNEKVNKILAILKEEGIDSKLCLKDKYLERYCEFITFYVNSSKLSSFEKKIKIYPLLYIFLIIGTSLITVLRYIIFYAFYYNKRKECKSDIYFIGAQSHIVRFAFVNHLFNIPVNITYLPKLNNLNIYNYLNKTQNPYCNFLYYTLSDIFISMIITLKYLNKIIKVDKRINKTLNTKNKAIFIRLFFLSMLIKQRGTKYIKKIDNPNRIKWILDMDFSYEFIILNSIIKHLRKDDVTIHLQHGAFWNDDNVSYCNIIADITLCGNEREKKIISLNNKYKAKIYPIGAPLQTFSLIEKYNNSQTCFDILVLLTETSDKKNLTAQKQLLKLLSEYKDLNILIRFRPASRKSDLSKLQKYISENIKISQKDCILIDDIGKSKNVISFSVDALYECIRFDKHFIFLINDRSLLNYAGEQSVNKIVFTYEEITDLNRNIILDDVTYADDKWIKYNFGTIEFKEYTTSLNNLINSL